MNDELRQLSFIHVRVIVHRFPMWLLCRWRLLPRVWVILETRLILPSALLIILSISFGLCASRGRPPPNRRAATIQELPRHERIAAVSLLLSLLLSAVNSAFSQSRPRRVGTRPARRSSTRRPRSVRRRQQTTTATTTTPSARPADRPTTGNRPSSTPQQQSPAAMTGRGRRGRHRARHTSSSRAGQRHGSQRQIRPGLTAEGFQDLRGGLNSRSPTSLRSRSFHGRAGNRHDSPRPSAWNDTGCGDGFRDQCA